jgi:hypothetical protein
MALQMTMIAALSICSLQLNGCDTTSLSLQSRYSGNPRIVNGNLDAGAYDIRINLVAFAGRDYNGMRGGFDY